MVDQEPPAAALGPTWSSRSTTTALLGIAGLVAAIVVFALMLRSEELVEAVLITTLSAAGGTVTKWAPRQAGCQGQHHPLRRRCAAPASQPRRFREGAGAAQRRPHHRRGLGIGGHRRDATGGCSTTVAINVLVTLPIL